MTTVLLFLAGFGALLVATDLLFVWLERAVRNADIRELRRLDAEREQRRRHMRSIP